ncbi:SulP family inorganic anion transporter [Nocardia sp. NPDC058658]|uniref:SulP family inorganic anion transporter n=1 Tax=Nocardia sp. NPDC058658 TaxID=3346580 RepID=UPI00365C57BB
MALPVFESLHGYRRAWLRPDVIAGLTVWAVFVPEALAYASLAGRTRRRPDPDPPHCRGGIGRPTRVVIVPACRKDHR